MILQGGSVHISDTFMWKSHQLYILLMHRSMETDSLIYSFTRPIQTSFISIRNKHRAKEEVLLTDEAGDQLRLNRAHKSNVFEQREIRLVKVCMQVQSQDFH